MAVRAGDIRVGGVYVEIGAKLAALEKGLRAASAKLNLFAAKTQQIGMAFLKAGTLISAPLVLSAKIFASYGDKIAKMARRTGVSAEALSAYAHAVELSGSSIESLEKGIRRMQQSIFDAQRGLITMTETLKYLGLTVEDLKNLKPEDQFLLIGDRLAAIQDDSTQAALAMQIFGRAGTELIPMFEAGSEELRKFARDAEFLGITIDDKTAKSAEQLNDQMSRMKNSTRGLSMIVGAILAPSLIKFANRFIALVVMTRDFIKQNSDLIIKLAKIGAILLTVGAGFTALALAAKTVAFIFAGIASAIHILGVLFSPLTVAIVAAIGSLLFLSDTFLSFLNLGKLGIEDLTEKIRVGGHSIQTWMSAAFYGILDVWERLVTGFKIGWDSLVMSAKWAGLEIYKGISIGLNKINERVWLSIEWMIDAYSSWNKKGWEQMRQFGLISEKAFRGGLDKIGRLQEGTAKFFRKQKDLATDIFVGLEKGALKEQSEIWKKFLKDKEKHVEELAGKLVPLEDAMTKIFQADIGKGEDTLTIFKNKLVALKKVFDDMTNKATALMGGEGGINIMIPDVAMPESVKSMVTGSFSAAAISGIAQGPLAKEQKKTNELLAQIEKNTAQQLVGVYG